MQVRNCNETNDLVDTVIVNIANDAAARLHANAAAAAVERRTQRHGTTHVR